MRYIALLVLVGCTGGLHRHIRVLASDEFEGRKPGTPGEEKTVAYLVDEFRKLGLETETQPVPLVGITTVETSMSLGGRALRYQDDFMAWTKREVPEIRAKGEIVFVGYGAVAPEYGWDDYKGLDCKGKILLMLVNDPFEGSAMTYYGRWTYKYEIAARMGAEGCIVIHEEEPAGYPWGTVRNSWSGEKFDIDAGTRCPFESWITVETARALFDYDARKQAASSQDFKPVPVGEAEVSVRTSIRRIESRNVIAKLRGNDEEVVYTAHWDHLGIGPAVDGDTIYNGAVDNASGVAQLLELARRWSGRKPKRTVVFLAVTAEEQGLLGSAWYARNPGGAIANINMDGANVYGRSKRVVVVGYGRTTLDDLVKEIAEKQGRTVVPDPHPEKGFYFRSDQFSFAKAGIPAIYAASDTSDGSKEYTKKRYHKPQDEYDSNWDLSGAEEDVDLYFELGRRIAESDWRPAKKKQ